MPATATRQRHKLATRDLILKAARDMFVSDGYESFSMRKLAQRIGYSPGAIYVHFRNKEEIFQSLVEQSFARLSQALSGLEDRHRDSDPVRLLKKGLYTYVEFGLRNPNDYRFAFLLQPPVQTEPYKVHPAFESLRYMVGRCIGEGRFREVDAETTCQALWAAIHGVTSLLIQRPTFPWVGRAKVIEQVINNAVDCLLAEVPASREGVRYEY
ncbi:MAG TPA: TetR/AcrR family transcriptional regulator [Terriglobales bacterium]|nr:TetR/AcrR family transcriptional regulator [Terriglobales bacterium]